jgi:hypothetical protein
MHLRPILQKDASPEIALVYQEIQRLFAIETVPLVFQYIANYEQYFFFLWERMKRNIQAENFPNLCHDIQTFAGQIIEVIETPSESLQKFIHQIHPAEKQYIQETITLLENTNTTLLLLLIDVRESLKSIFIGTQRLTQYASAMKARPVTEFEEIDTYLVKTVQEQHISEATNMLAPLFGKNSIMISQYPDFFAFIAEEMEKLKNTEAYLKSRVTLEHLTLQSITHFVQPLGLSYQEFLKLTQGKPYINELLYLLSDGFPSQFPHLVFTTACMKYLLLNHGKK